MVLLSEYSEILFTYSRVLVFVSYRCSKAIYEDMN